LDNKRTISKDSLSNIKLVITDFDGVLTDNKVLLSEDGKESVFCNRADGLGVEILKKHGIEIIILSSEKNNVVQKRADKLNIKAFNNVKNKDDVIKKISKEKGIDLQNIAYIGNDINDLPALEIVGLPLIVLDSSLELMKNYNFKLLTVNGGSGVLRYLASILTN
jgi:3-deoxy-D-manno-octulosonate 8-phosphate phosphatase (KDO 8-P phosphatase)